MNEEVSGSDAMEPDLTDVVSTTHPVEKPDAPKTEEPSKSEQPEEVDDDEPKEAKKSGWQKTKEQRDRLRDEVAALKAENESLKAPKPEVKQPANDGEPDPDKYDTTAAYFKDLAKWEAKQLLADDKKAAAEEAQKTKEQQYKHERAEATRQRADEFRKVAPDYNAVLEAYVAQHEVTEDMVEAIEESEMGPQVAYHIAKNPELGSRMAEMTPVQLAKEIGRIEARLEGSNESKKTTRASAPINPIRNNASSKTSLTAEEIGNLSPADYEAWKRS